MTTLLEDRVAAFVEANPGLTCDQIARSLRAQTKSVRDVLRSSGFERRSRSSSFKDKAVIYFLSSQVRDGLGRAYGPDPSLLSRRDLFLEKVTLGEGRDDCWIWNAHVDEDGYGTFRAEKGSRGKTKAHRYAFELFIGGIPDGCHLDHLCRNTVCVNPWHLRPVSASQHRRVEADRLRGKETDADFLLRVLRDGRPHNLNEILRRSMAERGCGITVHSRASSLRKRGYDIRNWKDGQRGNGSWYRLVGTLEGGALEPQPSAPPSSGPVRVDGALSSRDCEDGAAQLSLIPAQRGAYDEAAA